MYTNNEQKSAPLLIYLHTMPNNCLTPFKQISICTISLCFMQYFNKDKGC